jgi:hypothetical protein
VPIAAYDNRALRERIPDVATQLILGDGALGGRTPLHPAKSAFIGLVPPSGYKQAI